MISGGVGGAGEEEPWAGVEGSRASPPPETAGERNKRSNDKGRSEPGAITGACEAGVGSFADPV